MATNVEQYNGTGRRKTSVARVYVRPGSGRWEINGRPLAEYFPRATHQQLCEEPLVVAKRQEGLDVKITVAGGGQTGQVGAIRLGLARALVKLDEELRGAMRTHGMLTRDPREVERKKPGRPKARKRFQFSKR